MRIAQLAENDWQKYKDITLEATLKEPQAFASTYAKNKTYDEAKWRSRLSPFAVNTEFITLFAINEDDEVVGKVSALLFKENEIEIVGMYVRDSERGKGIGKKLLQEILSTIFSVKRDREIVIEVNAIQSAARELYAKIGFKEVSRSQMQLGDGKTYEMIKMILINNF